MKEEENMELVPFVEDITPMTNGVTHVTPNC